jgi:hypothetical protein
VRGKEKRKKEKGARRTEEPFRFKQLVVKLPFPFPLKPNRGTFFEALILAA